MPDDASHTSTVDGGKRAAAGYRMLVNPGTGEQIQFLAPVEGDEDVVRFNWSSIPGGAIPEHSHPHQEERFIISAQQAWRIHPQWEQRVVGAGETITVPVEHITPRPTPARLRLRASWSCAQRCTPGRCTRLSPDWRPKARPPDVALRRTRSRSRHPLELPPREPRQLTPHLGPEPHPSAALSPGETVRHPCLRRTLGHENSDAD